MGFSSVTDVNLIQSNLKSDSIFSYDYFLGKKHIRVYHALCIDTTGTAVANYNRYSIRTTQHMLDQTASVLAIIPLSLHPLL